MNFIRIQSLVRKTVLFVTHDIEEAIRLADKIAVMRLGKVVQYDTPLNILSNPADDFVADLVGSEDVLRRLSLLSVQSVMSPLTTIPRSTPMRQRCQPTQPCVTLLALSSGRHQHPDYSGS